MLSTASVWETCPGEFFFALVPDGRSVSIFNISMFLKQYRSE